MSSDSSSAVSSSGRKRSLSASARPHVGSATQAMLLRRSPDNAVPMAMPCSLRIASIFAFALAGTLAMMRFWLAVTTKPPGCTSAISRSAVRNDQPGQILDAAVLDEQRQVPLLVGALLPADDVAGRRELERARLAELA